MSIEESINKDTGIRFGVASASTLPDGLIERMRRLGEPLLPFETKLWEEWWEGKAGPDRRRPKRPPMYRYAEGCPGSDSRVEMQTDFDHDGGEIVWVFVSPVLCYRGRLRKFAGGAIDLDDGFDPHGTLGYGLPGIAGR
jgi:hypothetical protein